MLLASLLMQKFRPLALLFLVAGSVYPEKLGTILFGHPATAAEAPTAAEDPHLCQQAGWRRQWLLAGRGQLFCTHGL